MADKILRCRVCGSQFYFTEREQRFYKSKGLNVPQKCPNCRKKKDKHQQPRVPRACSTCYFYDGLHYYCKYSGGDIVNDAPCKHWQWDRYSYKS